MNQLGYVVAFAATVTGAWLISRVHSEFGRRTAYHLAVLLVIVLAMLALTGLFRPTPSAAIPHRWSGQLMIILAWVSVPYATGVLLERNLRRRPFAAMLQMVCLALFLSTTLMAYVTGFLGPGRAGTVDEVTRGWFTAYHQTVLPATMVVLLMLWLHFLKRPSDNA